MSVKVKLRNRFTFIYIVWACFALIAAVSLMWIVLGLDGRTEEATKIIAATTVQEKPIEPIRGDILAHDLRMLATTSFTYKLYTDLNPGRDEAGNGLPDSIFDLSVDSLAAGMSRILRDKTANEYAQQLKAARLKARQDKTRRTNRYRKLVPGAVDFSVQKALSVLPILNREINNGGLIVEKNLKRIHPFDEMARNTIGRTNAQGCGFIGLEASYNSLLSGTPGVELMQRAPGRNNWVPMSSEPHIPPINGYDIIMTLDVDMQTMVENIISKHLLANSNLDWGTAVLMEVHTGKVRAIANKRRIKNSSKIVEVKNYALTYRKAPGSTFKLVSYMGMLEKGMTLMDEVDTDHGTMKLYDMTISDEGSRGGKLTMLASFEKSSNVGTVKFIQRAYPSKNSTREFVQRIESLGLRGVCQYDIDPNRRLEPNIPTVENFSGVSMAMLSYGYELEVTPLQTLTLYNAVANDGVMVKPRFLEALRQDGRMIKRFSTQVVNSSICSDATLKKLQKMLVGVVNDGTAKTVQSKLFQVAAKTGTAHVAEDSTKMTKQKLASIVGYFPADNPQYSCIVMFKSFDTPVKIYGGAVAGPAFKEIAEQVYAHAETWNNTPIERSTNPIEAPYVKSGNRTMLLDLLNVLDIPVPDKTVAAPWISARPEGHEVAISERQVIQNLVPNVENMALRDAIFLLENAGLKVKFSGRGTVKEQQPMPGTSYKKGDVVTLMMTMSSL